MRPVTQLPAEVKGSGSASKGNEERDLCFTRLGLWVGHLPNEQVNREEILAVLGNHKRNDECS